MLAERRNQDSTFINAFEVGGNQRFFVCETYCPAVLSILLAIFTPLNPSTYFAIPR